MLARRPRFSCCGLIDASKAMVAVSAIAMAAAVAR
jgi:hypothetical protein